MSWKTRSRVVYAYMAYWSPTRRESRSPTFPWGEHSLSLIRTLQDEVCWHAQCWVDNAMYSPFDRVRPAIAGGERGLCLIAMVPPHWRAYRARATPAASAWAVILFLYAVTSPSNCSTWPPSQTHRLVHTFCSIVTSWDTIKTPPWKFFNASERASIASMSRWLDGSSRTRM
jgi:hypothetical protein